MQSIQSLEDGTLCILELTSTKATDFLTLQESYIPRLIYTIHEDIKYSVQVSKRKSARRDIKNLHVYMV